MIVVYHNNKVVVKVEGMNSIVFSTESTIQKNVYDLAINNPNQLIVWVNNRLKDKIDFEACKEVCHHELIMASYSTSGSYVIPEEYGFVEMVSPFLKVNRTVQYPTWLMSADIGVIATNVVAKSKELLDYSLSFEEYLCYLAKLSQDKGLLCYSAPQLIKGNNKKSNSKQEKDYSKLFRFVNATYSLKWTVLTLLNFMVYKRKLLLLSFLKGVTKPKVAINIWFNDLVISSEKILPSFEYDVLIPTLKRAKYLKDVLTDLEKQKILPKNVVIIEQDENNVSELEYLSKESWKFNIIHQCIDQFGACNARNLGLDLVKSNWVFLADDDIRLDSHFISNIQNHINKFKSEVINLSCLLENETQVFTKVRQWTTFGSGTTFLTRKSIGDCRFSMTHELSYGEDEDFGLQLRNKGNDIIYAPIELLHLKAPIGGFRRKVPKRWEGDPIQPIPSPTVLLNHIQYKTRYQLAGYKTLIFINKLFGKKYRTLISFNKNWYKSLYWASKLKEEYEF